MSEESIAGATPVVDPPVVPPVVTPPAATPPVVTPPVVPPVTPPVVAPPVTPPTVPPLPNPPSSIATAFELEVPKDGLLTKEYVTQFQKDAIAAGLSKDEAKDLLDTQYRAVKNYSDRNNQSVEAAKLQWREMSKADKEIGGENFNRTSELSRRLVEKFGDEEFRQLLNQSGFGNYPAVLRFLSKTSAAFSEDQLRPGSPSSGGATKSREDILFATSTSAGAS